MSADCGLSARTDLSRTDIQLLCDLAIEKAYRLAERNHVIFRRNALHVRKGGVETQADNL